MSRISDADAWGRAGRGPDDTRAQALRRRLLERVADDDDSHLSIGPDQGPWQPLARGVCIKVLCRHADALSYLLRMAPGARLPAHRHPMDEEGLVLQGWVRIGHRCWLGPGSYHRARCGSLHPPIFTDGGAMLFARGAVPSPDQVLR